MAHSALNQFSLPQWRHTERLFHSLAMAKIHLTISSDIIWCVINIEKNWIAGNGYGMVSLSLSPRLGWGRLVKTWKLIAAARHQIVRSAILYLAILRPLAQWWRQPAHKHRKRKNKNVEIFSSHCLSHCTPRHSLTMMMINGIVEMAKKKTENRNYTSETNTTKATLRERWTWISLLCI